MKNSSPDFDAALDRVLAWARCQDYKGHSKFDAFNSPWVRAASLNNKYLRMVISPLWARAPVNLRPLMRTTRSRNPKGIALFALAYIRRFASYGKARDRTRALELLEWLDQNSLPGFSGKCWGYDHDWQNLYFLALKNTPNIVVTGNVAYAFYEAYRVFGETRFFDVAQSSTDFMLNDLTAPFATTTMRSISYVPGNDWSVLNNSGLAATILLRIWKHTGNPVLRKEADRLMAFLMDKQTHYGAWHYAWPAKSSNVKHDNYHTGNVLDWLMDYITLTGDTTWQPELEKGLLFYRDNLFTDQGAPKWRSDRVFPHDAHGAGQAIVTFSKAALEMEPAWLSQAHRTAHWAVENLQHPDGWFYYQKGYCWTKKYTLMRWCNAWMALGLASYIRACALLEGKTPCVASQE